MKPDSVRRQAHRAIQRHLGRKFIHTKLLQQTLAYHSFNAKNDERSEFVGDAILNYSTAKMLFDVFSKLIKGEFSRLHANLVNGYVLAEIALEMSIGDGLYLGAGGLKSSNFRRPSVLADVMGAMSTTVSFDAGFTAAEEVVHRLFAERVKRMDFKNQGEDDKTVLQEALQTRYLPLLKYRVEEQVGGMKDSRFVVSYDLGELGFIYRTQGTSRKAAEQEAAAEALIWLERRLPLKKSKK